MISFHYETYGSDKNKPLLFLHGFMGSIAEWEDIIPFFSDEFYCLVVDFPGHGKTDTISEEDYLMENCANGIISLLDKLQISQCSMIAYSMGGRLAYYLSVTYPDRFDKVVIESSTPGFKTEKERKKRIALDEKRAQRLTEIPLEQFLDEWYQQPLFATIDKKNPQFEKLINRRLLNNPYGLSLSLEMMEVGRQPSLWSRLNKISADLLLIVGDKDDKFKKIAYEVTERCLTANMAIVSGAGHNVHFEKREEFVKQV
ncbi:MAG: 2-succinyl-6-hydroxy-2,4-cyclohexadiene-1-carboxylate synthase, partial [FCB group bacterium]|nr:2-succinyl-6-hydroxy-2,4-cyclohexadiene-1-carboxylate synthase [FCB group bacterium]